MEGGYDVSYMQGMVHAGNVLARTGRWESWRRGARWDKGAWVFTPMSFVPFSRMWPFNSKFAAHLSYLTCVPGIKRYLRKADKGDPDVIWTANPGSTALKSVFPDARLVFQVVDYYPAFSGSSIRTIEKHDYEAADHILVIGDTLKKYILDEHGIDPSKITVLGQGVFVDNYSQDLPIPKDISTLPGPLAVWVGVLGKGDPSMFEAAASALEERGGSLVLIGPGAQWADSLARRYANVHLLGARMPDEVPTYLVHSDIGLMLYDQSRQEVYKGQNPLKLYEYAAAGLPTISTRHDEYQYIDAPVVIVEGAEGMENAVNYALSNSDELSAKARKFADTRSWYSVFDAARRQVERLLGERGK